MMFIKRCAKLPTSSRKKTKNVKRNQRQAKKSYSTKLSLAEKNSESHADQQAGRVSNIRNRADDSCATKHEPNEHHRDGGFVQKKSRRRIKFSAHPDVTEQTVNDAGHATEIGRAAGES